MLVVRRMKAYICDKKDATASAVRLELVFAGLSKFRAASADGMSGGAVPGTVGRRRVSGGCSGSD